MNRKMARMAERAREAGREPDAIYVALTAAVLGTDDFELRIPWSALERARAIHQQPHFEFEIEEDKATNELVVRVVNTNEEPN